MAQLPLCEQSEDSCHVYSFILYYYIDMTENINFCQASDTFATKDAKAILGMVSDRVYGSF
jgi:hypothetical protein